MASSLCVNFLPFKTTTSSSSLLCPCAISNNGSKVFEPIVVNGNPPSFVSAPSRRIVAVGDLHGDIEQARYALEMAGVLSNSDLWIGEDTVLVQLGDILDRGQDEIAILSLFKSLDLQARAKGGAVFQVNGNHETMNVEGDFRYVDAGAFDECNDFMEYLSDYGYDWENAFARWVTESQKWKQDRYFSKNQWSPLNLVKKQKGVIARSVLFKPGGQLACELARHPIVLKINDWVFCHGGLLPHHVSYGVEKMNGEVSLWMRGLGEGDNRPDIPFMGIRGYDSVVWNRLYSRDTSDLEVYQIQQIQTLLRETLAAVGAKAMVVGHTPQTDGVNCKYDCSIWRIDVGMSSGVLHSRPELNGGGVMGLHLGLIGQSLWTLDINPRLIGQSLWTLDFGLFDLGIVL
ncbi:hypothetical protein ACFE04_015459 [Oxalis oulophora]